MSRTDLSVGAIGRAHLKALWARDPAAAKDLARAFDDFPEGALAVERDGDAIGLGAALRVPSAQVLAPHTWQTIDEAARASVHLVGEDWLYLAHWTMAPPPGIGAQFQPTVALLQGYRDLVQKLRLRGLAVPAPFPGFRERSGRTDFQRAAIEDPGSAERSTTSFIGAAHEAGLRHRCALPNYRGDGRHRALMVWSADPGGA
ncbi:MAG: hypothetical protein AAFY65_19515 [Pseudomonadota bacterium]